MVGGPPVIPDYELLRPIGRGAYGEVWLARSVTGLYRAAKIVYRANFEEARPFEREFAGIQRFEPLSREQENQITILHVGRNEAAGYFYYVMELADDGDTDAPPLAQPSFDATKYKPKTLKEVLVRRGRLPVVECLPVAIGLCNALEHLHQHGLIHRDVKPSNIIFVSGKPKLADIGLVSSVDATRSFVGTEGYMPREGSGSPTADLYSLGKVLYETATGRSRAEFPLLPADLEGIPDRSALLELNEVIVKACADDPSTRYSSAGDMRAELLLIQAGKSVKRLHAVERQLKRLVPAGVALAMLAGAIILIQQFQTAQVRQRAQIETEYRKKAEEQTLATRHLLYAADMNLVQQAFAVGDFGRARSLLEAHRPADGESDLRGFEWRYYWKATEGQQEFTLVGHSNAVSTIAFSPDNQLLASASYDGTVRLWNLATRTLLTSFAIGVGTEPGFSRDGTRLFFCNPAGRVESRDTKTHRRLFESQVNVSVMALSPAEDLLAIFPASQSDTSVQGARILFLDPHNGKEIYSLPGTGDLLRFSPDGRRLAASAGDRQFKVWDLAQRRVLANFKTKESRFDLCFSPNGETLAQGDAAGNLRLWNLSSNGAPRELAAHQGSIWQVAFAPDGKTLATVGTDQTLRVWDVDTLAERAVYRGHSGEVWGLAFSPDGKQIATGSKDETVRFWNIGNPSGDQALTRHGRFWHWPVFSSDGGLIAAGETGAVRIWRTSDGTEVGSFTNANKPLMFTDDQRSLWTCSSNGMLQLLTPFEPGSSSIINITNAASATVRAHAFHSRSQRLALGQVDGTVRIRHVTSGTELHAWKAHSARLTALAFSPQGDALVTASEIENDVKLWSTSTRALRHSLSGHKLGIFSVGFSPDGKQIASASEDDTCRLWDVATGRTVALLDGHKGGAFAVAFAPDGKTLAVGTGNQQIRLWNLKTLRDMGAIQTEPVTVFFAGFSPDAQTLATVSYGTSRNQCALRLLRTGSVASRR